MRIGQGFDVHRLVSGRRLIIGGVEISYEMGLLGHSDADVLVHALMDALLGAIGAGDIGAHFPDQDPDYKDIDSTILLQRVLSLINDQGYQIANLDATIIAERPKLAGYIPQIRQRIADLARINMGQVSVKATTTEGLGFTGRGEGIGALAVVLLEQKQS